VVLVGTAGAGPVVDVVVLVDVELAVAAGPDAVVVVDDAGAAVVMGWSTVVLVPSATACPVALVVVVATAPPAATSPPSGGAGVGALDHREGRIGPGGRDLAQVRPAPERGGSGDRNNRLNRAAFAPHPGPAEHVTCFATGRLGGDHHE
jgi:hypothetical protein